MVRVRDSSITAVPKSTSLTSTLAYKHQHCKSYTGIYSDTHLRIKKQTKPATKITKKWYVAQLNLWVEISGKLQEVSSWGTEQEHWMVQSVLRNQLFLQYLHQSGNTQQSGKSS